MEKSFVPSGPQIRHTRPCTWPQIGLRPGLFIPSLFGQIIIGKSGRFSNETKTSDFRGASGRALFG